MENPEHKIKEAFAANDARTVFAGKEELWGRLNNAMAKRKGVPAIWRVAAVFLCIILFTGVFASINFKAKMEQEKRLLNSEKEQLQFTIDSLLTLPAKTETETRLIEKVVYRDRPVQQSNIELRSPWEEKYRQLKDSSEADRENQFRQYKNELSELQAKLDTIKENFTAYKNQVENQNRQSENAPFQLKSERVDLEIQKSRAIKKQEMELKVFPVNFQESKNNMNKSILKK